MNNFLDENSCLKQIGLNFGVGAALGSSVGAVYGTYDAFRNRVPGLFKIRHIGKSTLSTGAIFGTFLAAGALIRCGN